MQWKQIMWIKKTGVHCSSFDKLWYKMGVRGVILSILTQFSTRMICEMFTRETEWNG